MKRTTMRINIETQRALALQLAKCMNTGEAWYLDGDIWTVESFRPVTGTKQITVYLKELCNEL